MSLYYAPVGNLTDLYGISGEGKLIMSGTGSTLTLGGTNTYSGGTLLEGGTLKTSDSAALGDGGLTITAGTLDLDGSSALQIASLAGSNAVVTSSASGTCTLTVGPGSGSFTTFSGTITNGKGVVGLTLSDSPAEVGSFPAATSTPAGRRSTPVR